MTAIPMFFKSIEPGKAPAAAPKKGPTRDAPDAGGDRKSDIVPHEPTMGHFTELLSLLAERGAGGGDFGPHNVEPGHQVTFQAGALAGDGEVSAVGRDGIHVLDGTGREHRVHWREVTGHHPGKDAAGDAPGKKAADAV